jgi:hypothetical protein
VQVATSPAFDGPMKLIFPNVIVRILSCISFFLDFWLQPFVHTEQYLGPIFFSGVLDSSVMSYARQSSSWVL